MKICNKCKQEKSFSEFNKNKRKKDGLQDYCKTCKSKSDNKYYLENTESFNIRNKKWSEKRFKEIEKIFINRSCKKCGETRTHVLDFHHIDPLQKEFNIGPGKKSYKTETILNEIEKCITLCSNCHRDFHYLEKIQGITIEQYLKN